MNIIITILRAFFYYVTFLSSFYLYLDVFLMTLLLNCNSQSSHFPLVSQLVSHLVTSGMEIHYQWIT